VVLAVPMVVAMIVVMVVIASAHPFILTVSHDSPVG
jgi:hypothetical protein